MGRKDEAIEGLKFPASARYIAIFPSAIKLSLDIFPNKS